MFAGAIIRSMATDISYELKRTRRRRSLALQVSPDGRVTVFAPRLALGYFIDRFVQRRADWIREKLAYFAERRKALPPKEFVSREWHSRDLLEKLTTMVPSYAVRMGVAPGKIRIANQ